MIQLLKDKVAIIASCSEAVALSVSRLFLQQGASVMIVGALPESLTDYPEAENQERWARLQADMTDPVEARYCASETIKRFGQLDILFYYPSVEKDDTFTPVGQSSEHAIITYTQDMWSQLVTTLPGLREASSSNIIAVSDTSSDSELRHVGEVENENHRTRIDLINAMQRYQPKRQQSLTAHKQLTPERIARLSLSLLIKEKQEEVEWNEVLSWTSEYLDTTF